ncbi:hypothetical protein [Enterovirga rhinocerotis]|uniref:Uncharacterized protein n=1 Tax=Enterovirga rhinocerotis TaxID=1339210 RepID=A0A4R7BJT5_9HYPH|nr:hypothetical protein [Enterovirga rhinocerotis]TDR85273.1 hypothetical protein EV668_4822 [Enterovirga rhinocerotis]
MPGQPPQEAIDELARFPLLDALFGRRSRRFGLGMSIPDGPLAYASRHAPQPLSEAERLVLIAASVGLSGWNLGIPHTESGDPEAGNNYPVRPIGRTYPSGGGAQGSEILINDDSGAYITRFRDLDADAIREYAGAGSLERLLDIVRSNVVRLGERVELPAEHPFIAAHNRWVANRPGTTLFVPIADQVDSTLNHLWIRTGEGAPITDHRTGRVLGDPSELIADGFLKPERATPLAVLEANSRMSTTSELAIAAYNVQLVMQAIGLGGWLFSGINIQALLGGFAGKGLPGFGFDFAHREGWLQPVPLGRRGVFEPLVPPFVADMHEAVRRFADRKFGPGGVYDPARPGPYRDNGGIKARTDRYSESFVRYLGTLAQDIYDTSGRFPATQPSVSVGPYTQAQHIDLDFYDRFYKDGAYLDSHRRHQALWHGERTGPIPSADAHP